MKELTSSSVIGVLGAGAMGAGIAQVASAFGHKVFLFDTSNDATLRARASIDKALGRQVEKKVIGVSDAKGIHERISTVDHLDDFSKCGLVIEAIVEQLDAKQRAFSKLETVVSQDCILASNTSSLSIASIASMCRYQERVVGLHFFNPAPVMPLVEVIPSINSNEEMVNRARSLIDRWGKVTVLAKDTPGFIVNRVARPYYGEALRVLEEQIADVATIDWAMREIGGFRMGPFELMDFIGNDVNFKVTETVFEAFFYDARYRPSLTQKRLVEARLLGRKTGRGYYDYRPEATIPEPKKDKALGDQIFKRIHAMLVNEAAEALYLGIASREDIDLAMTKGVNYPKGLLKWADEIGLDHILGELGKLHSEYGDDRYRPSVLLKRLVREGKKFY